MKEERMRRKVPVTDRLDRSVQMRSSVHIQLYIRYESSNAYVAGMRGEVIRTVRVWTRLYRMQQLHCRDVVDVYLGIQHHDQPFPIHLDAQHRSGKDELADGRLPLLSQLPSHPAYDHKRLKKL